jgi:hypothetical protein
MLPALLLSVASGADNSPILSRRRLHIRPERAASRRAHHLNVYASLALYELGHSHKKGLPMPIYSFYQPHKRFKASFDADSHPRAQVRAALLSIAVLADREAWRNPPVVRIHDISTSANDTPYFNDEFFEPWERWLAALFARCGSLETASRHSEISQEAAQTD